MTRATLSCSRLVSVVVSYSGSGMPVDTVVASDIQPGTYALARPLKAYGEASVVLAHADARSLAFSVLSDTQHPYT